MFSSFFFCSHDYGCNLCGQLLNFSILLIFCYFILFLAFLKEKFFSTSTFICRIDYLVTDM